MNTRIRQLREDLHLSQKEFGERIGISRDAEGNIEYGRTPIKEYIIKLVCKEYHVNEEWLRTGKGEMYTDKMTDDQTDALLAQFGLEGLEAKIARAYLELDHDTRMYVINHFRKYIEEERAHPEEEYTIAELEEEYKKSRLDAAKKKEPSASNITGGGEKNNA